MLYASFEMSSVWTSNYFYSSSEFHSQDGDTFDFSTHQGHQEGWEVNFFGCVLHKLYKSYALYY